MNSSALFYFHKHGIMKYLILANGLENLQGLENQHIMETLGFLLDPEMLTP